MRFKQVSLALVAGLISALLPSVAYAAPSCTETDRTRLTSGLQGGSGSTVGPDGALYVTEGAAGRVSRVDPRSGAIKTFASGLPKSVIGLGGAIDVAFIGRTAYVLVTLVGPDVGGRDTVGIYRVDGPDRFTVVADIGAYALSDPPETAFEVPTGLQYALQVHRRGFLVTDGHHNRVLRVSLDGRVSELRAFGNIVPTGLDVSRTTLYMAQAGPLPYAPEDGKVVAFGRRSRAVTEVASGVRFLVDVEFGPGHRLYALSQGRFGGGNAASPAKPDTGSLVRLNRKGTFSVVADRLDRPTSLDFIGRTAYVVELSGEVWRFACVSRRSYGRGRPAR